MLMFSYFQCFSFKGFWRQHASIFPILQISAEGGWHWLSKASESDYSLLSHHIMRQLTPSQTQMWSIFNWEQDFSIFEPKTNLKSWRKRRREEDEKSFAFSLIWESVISHWFIGTKIFLFCFVLYSFKCFSI